MRPGFVDPTGLLQGALEVYRKHFAVLFPLALIFGLIQAIIQQAFGSVTTDEISTSATIGIFISLIPTLIFLGFVVELLRDRRAGKEVRPTGELVRSVLPLALPLLSLGLLSGVAVVAGLILLIVPGLLLLTIWAVVLPVYVIERPGFFASFGRSRALVRGFGWPVFGTIMLMLLVAMAGALVAGIISVDPTSPVGSVVQLVIISLVTPVTTLMLTGLYFRLVDLHGSTAHEPQRDTARGAFGVDR